MEISRTDVFVPQHLVKGFSVWPIRGLSRKNKCYFPQSKR